VSDQITLTLPDGATRDVPRGTLPLAVVESIGKRLARDAVAVSVDGVIQDVMTPLRAGGAFVVHTRKSPESLGVLRHSAAHVLATAVRAVRPDAKIGFGPAIDDGFYYDFEVASPFTPDDLAGKTFTISNPGKKGNLVGGAIISQPNVGILRTGEIKKRVVVVEHEGEDLMAIHPVMHMALSYDHRIVDGVAANGFLYRVGEILEAADFSL